MDKIVILGSRSGTSTMAKLLQKAGGKLLIDNDETEHKGLSQFILTNISDKEAIKEYLKTLPKWTVLKCPELAFCLDAFNEVFPGCKYIWMQRSLKERVNSHINMGWHRTIFKRIKRNAGLRNAIESITETQCNDAIQSDTAYFQAMDLLMFSFLERCDPRILFVEYNHFNVAFEEAMQAVSTFCAIDYDKYIKRWKKIKNKPQQAGRWK